MRIKLNRFPYLSWGLLTLLLFVGTTTAYFYQKSLYTPESMTVKVQKDFQTRETHLLRVMKSGILEDSLQWNQLIPESRSFAIFIEHKDSIIFWNTDQVSGFHPNEFTQLQSANGSVLKMGCGFYYGKRISISGLNGYSAVALIPVAYVYSDQLKYVKSHFVADSLIPETAKLIDTGKYIVRHANGQVAFRLSYPEDLPSFFRVSNGVILLAVFFLSALFLWLNKICITVVDSKHSWKGFFLLLLFAILITLLRLYRGYPEGFLNTPVFSPEILASNSFIGSLPDLMLQVFVEVWLIYFFNRYISVQQLNIFKKQYQRIGVRLLIAFVLLLDVFGEQTNRIHTIIINSKIPFVVNNLENLTVFSFIGFGLLALVTLTILFLFYFIDRSLKYFLKTATLRYTVIFIMGIGAATLFKYDDPTQLEFDIMLLVYAIFALWFSEFSNIRSNFISRKVFFFNSNTSYILIFILCLWVTGELFYFNFEKERDFRKVFVFKHNPNNLLPLRFPLDQLAKEVGKNNLIREIWRNPNPNNVGEAKDQLRAALPRSGFKDYKAAFYFLTNQNHFLTQSDSLDFEQSGLTTSLLKVKDKGNQDFIESVTSASQQGFLGRIKIADTTGKGTAGYLYIFLSAGENPGGNQRAMLSSPTENPSDQQFSRDYSYAVYAPNKLLYEEGSYHFPENIINPISSRKTFIFKEHWLYSELFFAIEKGQIMVVRYDRNVGFNIVSLFSYALSIWLVLALILTILFYGTYANNPTKSISRFGLTIRAKIVLAILSVIALSLIVIGGITFSYQKRSFEQLRNKEIQTQLSYFVQTIGRLWNGGKQQPDTLALNRFLTNVADVQGLDIYIYSVQGRIISTSINQSDPDQLISKFMDPTALHEFKNDHRKIWVTFRKIDGLNHQGFFMPIKNDNNQSVAYLYLPNYISGESIKSELSDLLTTLFNIYMLVFFIGGLVAVMISNGILRSFYILIEKFRQIRLRHNVLIQWPYRDELGLLAAEYNSMILRVERMATQLASNEREEAWRELALQVAHEIKNPLTPMKLNLQYLQKSIAEGRTDITEMVQKMSNRLVEQIENLNQIATEFANFARMPVSRPEKIEIVALLNDILELHKEQGELNLESDLKQVFVFMDKNYFIRIFTNLIKNALQAIPEQVKGVISVKITEIQHLNIKISVKDNGIGIPEEIAQNIFQPHFTTKNSGSGLGLAMTKKMVELSEGSIDFETESGLGTCFYVILPLFKENLDDH